MIFDKMKNRQKKEEKKQNKIILFNVCAFLHERRSDSQQQRIKHIIKFVLRTLHRTQHPIEFECQ